MLPFLKRTLKNMILMKEKNRLLEDLKSIGKTQYDFNALLIPKNIIEFSNI